MQQQSKVKTLLVDDEELALDLVEHLLKDFSKIEVVGKAQSVNQAKQVMRNKDVDLLLLDIQMPGQTGIEFYATLPSPKPLVIFITAYDHFAVQAFEHHAVDYLLKPTSQSRLKQAVERSIERLLNNNNRDNIDAAVEALMPSVSEQRKLDKLTIKDSGEIYFIDYENIVWIEAAGDYMCVYTPQKRHILRATMKGLEEDLPTTSFIRVHRSKLINISHVQQATVLPKGESLLTMSDGAKVKVSRNFRQQLTQFI